MAKKPETNEALQNFKQDMKARQLGNLYVFHGEETFLLRYYLEQLRKTLIDELTESFNYHRFTAETFDVQSFADAVENLPMMAEHTMVQVDDIDLFKLAEGERDKLSQILSDIPEYCTVVFTYETVEWKLDSRFKKLSSAIEKNGQIIPFCLQEQRDLVPWITRHFAANKKRIVPELCVYLIELTGGSMTALSGEIQKISSFSGADTITKSDIDAVTEPVLDAVIYQMTEFLGRKDYASALQKLHQLLKMQLDPIYILGSVGSHFRKIATAKTLLDYGKGAGDLMKLYSISEYPAKKTMDASRRFSAEFLSMAATLILETDRKMKTSYDNPVRLLELLILQLAQEALDD